MKKALKQKYRAIAFLSLLLSACGVDETTPAPISVSVTPNTANAYVGESVQFAATVFNSTNREVTWTLSGVGCSGAACGTISSTGLYTAPASAPNPPIVTVKVTAAADTSKSASATITIQEAIDWTWVSGSNITDQAGVYGTKGIPAPTNVPGARQLAVSWLDSSGALWLFGGDGWDSEGAWGLLNDLWKYDPTSNEWTWVSGGYARFQAGTYGIKGTADPTNVPGARQSAVSWLDSSGKLWLFGGLGLVSASNFGELNDLWKYDPTSNEWTWVSGSDTGNQAGNYGTRGTADPTNVPGAREAAVSWLDSSGKLWLFGGSGYSSVAYDFSYLNDLWKFDPTTFEWTWVSGSNTLDQLGVYGTKGTADPSNVPGARVMAVSWLDSSGKLWLFGGWGWGHDFADNSHMLNDLWNFNPTTLEWTWISGSNTIQQPGVYGTKGTADPTNVPGARDGAVSWLDSSGKLWLFGGSGYDSVGLEALLNDLWKYDPLALEWTWVSGSNIGNQEGIYGTKGTADASNVPGARNAVVSWHNSQGKLWLFGGWGYDSVGQDALLNDLWLFIR